MTTTPEKRPNNCKKGIHADGMCYCLEDKPTPDVEKIVLEASNRLCKFEHEPSLWHGMMVYEAGDIEGFLDWLRTTLHHQLQKAREEGYNAGLADGTGKPLLAVEQMLQKARTDWLREEIVRLGGMKKVEKDEQREIVLDNGGKVKGQTHYPSNVGYNQALQTIIDRYQAELDQDVSK